MDLEISVVFEDDWISRANSQRTAVGERGRANLSDE